MSLYISIRIEFYNGIVRFLSFLFFRQQAVQENQLKQNKINKIMGHINKIGVTKRTFAIHITINCSLEST